MVEETEKSVENQVVEDGGATDSKANVKGTIAPRTAKVHPLKNLDSQITFEDASKERAETIDGMWNIVRQSSCFHPIEVSPSSGRKGWQTIRLFVSSTFRDFYQEREVLVKQVVPDLRLWCESRKLKLVECDLRWGVPRDTKAEDTIKICLSELDRCYEENTAPFFLNLTGDRAGWVPTFDDLSANLAAQYGWVNGLSVTEMEIVHGSMRKYNPNALFMVRTTVGAEEVPDAAKDGYFDDNDFRKSKLAKLKSELKEKYTDSHVHDYTVECKYDEKVKKMRLEGLDTPDSEFVKKVYDFFKQRIDELYPLDESPSDPLEVQKEAHETYLLSRSSNVLGRDNIISKIDDYVLNGSTNNAPLLIVGVAGAGKSALMAKCASNATELNEQGKIKINNNDKQCNVFFHFVGATPRSTDLASFLQRLTKEMKPDQQEPPSNLDTLINLAYNLLTSADIDPIVIFVDAINQMDSTKDDLIQRWIPDKLSPNVRMVVSTIEGTESHATLRSLKSNPMEIICGPLDKETGKAIVTNYLHTYNKKLGEDQMDLLLSKSSSCYPLWLTLACEELRVYGVFETLTQKIESLPNELISLEESVFERFESGRGGQLMRACVCLLEVARHGLLETELLELLGQKERLAQIDDLNKDDDLEKKMEMEKLNSDDKDDDSAEQLTKDISQAVEDTYLTDRTDGVKGSRRRRVMNEIPAIEWAVIYRNLKPLLRPCGDLGEGRLDFYHRSLSKAVRKRYFSGDEELVKQKYNFWHGVLADYFEGVDDMDRKTEELPYHLEKLMDNNRLLQCLMDWGVFERMYSEEFSIDLVHSWQQCGGYGVAAEVYRKQLAILKESDMPLIDYVEVLEKVYGFLIQVGKYDEAVVMMEERLKEEEENLGKRPGELADLYQNMAKCLSELGQAAQYISREGLERDRSIVEYCIKSMKYREELDTEDKEFRFAMTKVLMSFHRSCITVALGCYREGEDEIPVQNGKAFEEVDEAYAVFCKLNDLGHMAECGMVKAMIDRNWSVEKKVRYLQESLDLVLKGYGYKHALTARIIGTLGVCYACEGDLYNSFEWYSKWRDCAMETFGPTHPRTIRVTNVLKEPRYVRVAEELGRTVPGTA